MTQGQQFMDALIRRYQADKAEGVAILNLYVNQSVGVGEHPDVLTEMDKAIEKISSADGKIGLLSAMLKAVNEEPKDGQ